MKQRTFIRTLSMLVLALALALTGSASADTVDVDIASFAFSPSSLTISAGTTVRWTNSDAVPHTSTADDALWDSGNLGNGQSYSRTFTEVGTHPYHCTLHPSMTATITVEAVKAPGLNSIGLAALALLLIGSTFWIYRRRRV